MPELLVQKKDFLKRVTLNRPEKRNALNVNLASQLIDEVKKSESDGTRLLVLEGAGDSFCAGFDFSNINDCSNADLLTQFIRIEEMLQAVAYAPFDTLAIVRGYAMGAGADLVISCRHRVGVDQVLGMAFPGPKFGLILGTRRLATCIGGDNAARLVGGNRVTQDDILRLGILDRVIPMNDQEYFENQILAHILSIPIMTRQKILTSTRVNTSAEDMLDLIESIQDGNIKDRIMGYLKELKKR